MSDSDTRPDDDVFDVERIRRLVELMEGHDLREIDLRQNQQRIRLCRGPEVTAMPSLPMASSAVPATPQMGSPGQTSAAEPSGSAAETSSERAEENIVMVTSPMVGTFYGRANPNSDPYVKVGDMVDPETTVCVVEAMKVFNEIPAETRGKIVAVLVEDQEPVDHGRPLFKVDTSVS